MGYFWAPVPPPSLDNDYYSMQKVDVCINYYGKPYQTGVTLLSLWKYSSRHIQKIFVIVEKVQPYEDYGSVPLLKYLLKDLPVEYVYPKHFYYAGCPPVSWLTDPEKRYGLKYQYALEQSKSKYLFLTHNDCLYHDDLVGKMKHEIGDDEVAGIGLIGQCWNCPAQAAGLCDGTMFEHFKPSANQLREITEEHNPPRKAIHMELIDNGFVHPLPECRLNEYACLIDVPAYQQNVVPKGDILPLGGNWHGTDWGTVWFHEMYNRGYQFINFPFEPEMTHAPFSDNGSGHKADSDEDLYKATEQQAFDYLVENKYIGRDIPVTVSLARMQHKANYLLVKFSKKVKNKLNGIA
jgi:hypothetical protein